MFQTLINRLSLTPTEQKVILFLAGTLIVGTGVRYYREASASGTQFDYRNADSTFALFRQKVSSETAPQPAAAPGALVNVNTASAAELVQIPGIGTTLAARIVSHRETNGRFRTVDELQKVKGISRKKLEKLRPFISVH